MLIFRIVFIQLKLGHSHEAFCLNFLFKITPIHMFACYYRNQKKLVRWIETLTHFLVPFQNHSAWQLYINMCVCVYTHIHIYTRVSFFLSRVMWYFFNICDVICEQYLPRTSWLLKVLKYLYPLLTYGNLFYRKLSTKHENPLIVEKFFKKICFWCFHTTHSHFNIFNFLSLLSSYNNLPDIEKHLKKQFLDEKLSWVKKVTIVFFE